MNAVRAREAAWVAVLLAMIAAAFCASYAAAALLGAAIRGSASGLAAAIAIRETSTFVVLAIVMRRYLGLTLRDLGLVRPSGADVALGVLSGVAVIVVTSVIAKLVGEHRWDPIYAAMVRGDGISQTAALLMVGVWSPFVQEVVFRGALLTALRERLPGALCVALTAVAFAFVHAASGLTAVLTTFVGGLVLGALTLRRATLTAAVVCHITINVGVTAPYVVFSSFSRH